MLSMSLLLVNNRTAYNLSKLFKHRDKNNGGIKLSELDLIIAQLNRMETKQDEANKCLVKCKLDVQQLQNDTKKNLENQVELKTAFLDHIKNNAKHFNPYYEESLPAKVWRKKSELGVAGAILFIIERIIENGGIP